jgi:hypothetical protein
MANEFGIIQYHFRLQLMLIHDYECMIEQPPHDCWSIVQVVEGAIDRTISRVWNDLVRLSRYHISHNKLLPAIAGENLVD